MNKNKLDKLVSSFLDEYAVFAPTKQGDRVLISKIDDPSEVYWGSQMTEYSWKKFLLPTREKIFSYGKSGLREASPQDKKEMLLGVGMLDLRAMTFYSEVFEKDKLVQDRLKKLIIVGVNVVPEGVEQNVFRERYEKNVLKSLKFDIFIGNQEKEYLMFTGSEDGQRLLDKNGIKGYSNVNFDGYKKEPDKKDVRDSIQNSLGKYFWKELGETCIECGKCTIVCPTCYCYELTDVASAKPGKGRREREWSSCFYPEFSEVSGGKKNLETTEGRIYFWYHHKFVRDFDNVGAPGCVGCGRCSAACPAGIKLNETLKKALDSSGNPKEKKQ